MTFSAKYDTLNKIIRKQKRRVAHERTPGQAIHQMGSDSARRDLYQHSARRDLYESAGLLRRSDRVGNDSGAADLRRGDRVSSEPDRTLR